MKRVNVLFLFPLLIAILAVSEFGFAADTDGSVNTAVVEADAGDNSEDDKSKGDDEDNEEDNTVVTTGYSASISDAKRKNGRCHKEVTVKGPGIDDVIPVDCAVDNFVFSNNTMLVVGGALYSDTPNTVVVVKHGRCEKRTYSQPQAGSTPGSPGRSPNSPATTKLSPRECATIRRTMAEARSRAMSQLNTLGSGLQGGLLSNNVGTTFKIPLADDNSDNGFMNNFRFGL